MGLFSTGAVAFSDIQNHWANACISQMRPRNLVTGYPDGTFRPNGTLTRAEFAVLMMNAFPNAPIKRGGMAFSDVPTTHWAHRAIQAAYQRGFFSGYPGGIFQPSQAIPRAQAIGVLAGAINYSIPANPEAILRGYYLDAAQIPDYARNAIAAASINNIVVNYPAVNTLRPTQAATRGEIAALLCRGVNIYAVPPQYIAGIVAVPQTVYLLPGALDPVPVFNSNSPELFRTEGILLSSFPPAGKRFPAAHLDYGFQGRFDIFTHHIARAETEAETHPFYQGILVHNPGQQPVTLQLQQAVTYLSTPDAPFVSLPDRVDDPNATVYSGPGSRVMNEVLRGVRQPQFPAQVVLSPGESRMILNLPVPVSRAPASNGRSTMMRLESSGEVYVANLVRKANRAANGSYTAPSLADWQVLLADGNLATPRGPVPTPLDPPQEPTVFGRVAGISQGARWIANITDSPQTPSLTIPTSGNAVSYVLGTLHLITLGTNQIQSAPMLRRYPDSAYFAHSNYGVEYNLTLPLSNPTGRSQTVAITFQSPLKDEGSTDRLLFVTPRDERVFFRGTVRVRYLDEQNIPQTRYVHLVQRRGQQGEPLVTLSLAPNTVRMVDVDFIYPADITPPQVLTVRTF